MQKIIPHLWFDTQAKEAAEFYVSTFGRDLMESSAEENHADSLLSQFKIELVHNSCNQPRVRLSNEELRSAQRLRHDVLYDLLRSC